MRNVLLLVYCRNTAYLDFIPFIPLNLPLIPYGLFLLIYTGFINRRNHQKKLLKDMPSS